ncbi:hypothetical protein AOLI_G00330530 [Acnodon oligacanthus]
MWLLKLAVALTALCLVCGDTKTDKPAEQRVSRSKRRGGDTLKGPQCVWLTTSNLLLPWLEDVDRRQPVHRP